MKKRNIIIISLIIISVPIVLYLLDYFNVFTLLKLTSNVNTDTWLSSIYTYIAAIIGAISLVYITQYQIRKTFDYEREINKEAKRIENAPYIEYEFDTVNSTSELNSDSGVCLVINNSNMKHDNIKKDCNEIILTCKLTNIGLGHAKNFIFGTETPVDRVYHRKDILKRDSSIDDSVIILFDKNEMEEEEYEQHKKYYSLKYYVYYQDMLNNTYRQIINLKILLSFSRENDSIEYMNHIDSFQINECELIDELPLFKNSHIIELVDVPRKK